MLADRVRTDPASVLASPLSLIGSADEIGERLRERRERWGYSYTVVPGDKAHAFAPIVAELTGAWSGVGRRPTASEDRPDLHSRH